MKRIVMALLVAVSVMCMSTAAMALRDEIAQRWIRSHPFMIAGWVIDGAALDTEADIQTYLDAEFSYFSYTDPSSADFMELAKTVAPDLPLWVWSLAPRRALDARPATIRKATKSRAACNRLARR